MLKGPTFTKKGYSDRKGTWKLLPHETTQPLTARPSIFEALQFPQEGKTAGGHWCWHWGKQCDSAMSQVRSSGLIMRDSVFCHNILHHSSSFYMKVKPAQGCL